ncbi:LacI family DNA-binding transcriptional regulator [Desmospora profundinema]|uniref:LacI family transcriptional regulator n=1 Tax=Desmospora profundinema TaxID=1571184 RepID=A0ABU1IK04_9BACL|nr:substrate-binding domain-containing protein [Desmospora profundinema]MDR6225088.1 LacI family transcriptional regulator [Desmospora profundinema]
MGPTIKDVAKKANVSTATVSRILNDLPGYSKETKEKVMKVIEELGYQPNAVARGLVSKRTQTIGVLFPDVSSMFSSEILNGIEDTAHELGSSVIVCNTDRDGKRTMKYLQLLQEKRVDGVIFTSEVLTEEYYETLMDMQVPVVLVSTASYRYPLPYVKVDDKHAAYTATEYLIQNGHTQIAMISGRKEDPIAGAPRVEGYKQALSDYGIPIHEESIVYTDGFGFQQGQESFPRIAEKLPEVTAVFAASDEMAVGAMSAAYQLGIQIPDQLSIIGYDNLKIAEMSIPPLTTVAQPLYQMGEVAAKLLNEMLRTGSSVESRIMPHHIVERCTVKRMK